MPNTDRLDAALTFLKERVRLHRKRPGPFNEGARFGAFRALCRIGFGDAALEAVRQVEEDEKRGRNVSRS